MRPIQEASGDYLKTIADRKNGGHIFRSYQFIGLEVAKLLADEPHKALYIKLAKQFGTEKMMTLAKSVAEINNIRNKGAYFMKLLYSNEHSHDKK
ncbi:MAG: hypothetical protein Q7R85_01410 [bacterium]|nr:hypothetical protein [bacterium]